MWSNVLYAARVLRKSPKFTATVLLTLALGIGANAAIFSVVSAVLVRRLPIRDPQNVVVVHDQFPTLNLPRTTVSVLQFRDFSDRKDLFQSTAALKRMDLTLTGQGQALRIQGMAEEGRPSPLCRFHPEGPLEMMFACAAITHAESASSASDNAQLTKSLRLQSS